MKLNGQSLTISAVVALGWRLQNMQCHMQYHMNDSVLQFFHQNFYLRDKLEFIHSVCSCLLLFAFSSPHYSKAQKSLWLFFVSLDLVLL